MLPLLLAACDGSTAVAPYPPRERDTDDTPADTAPGDTAPTDTAPGDTAPTDTAPPSPACGDGATTAPEECDGADDGTCPGRCSSDCACPSLPATGELALHMIDVGQGDGMVLVSPDGFVLMVDTGDEDHLADVRDYLAAAGVPALDHVLVSHFHADHMGAMAGLLRAHPEVGYAFDSGGRYDSDQYEQYVRAAGDKRHTVVVGDTIDLGPSTTVDVLHASAGDTENENNNSVVIRVTYGDVRLLLGGDCESPVCEGAFDPGPIDVYKVHHHGSYNGSSATLLDEMQPKTALISVGADNSYGHPADQTIDRLTDVGATIWRTDLDGDIVVRSDGTTWTTNGIP